MRKFISIFYSASLLACLIATWVYLFLGVIIAEAPPQDYTGEDPRGVALMLFAYMLPFIILLTLIPVYSIFIKCGVFSSGSKFLGILAILHDGISALLIVLFVYSGGLEISLKIPLLILSALGVGSLISVVSALRNP